MPRKALSLILFGLSTLGLTAQSTTLYWVGGNGNWNEPANWSASASGAGSTSLVPTAETQVVLQSTRAGSVEVFITGAAVCHSLSIADQALARVLPSGTLSLTAVDDPSRVINAGAVVVQSPPAPGMRSAMTDGPGLWYAPDALAGDGFTPLSLMDTDCGTGGADPYNIDIQIQSDYNGQAISCNTASDGALTVNVAGGIGPFSFQWVGGSLPPTFTQSITGLAAGTYTVLVTDLGQGTICSETVVLSAPPAITLLDFTPNPPSCASLCDGSATVLAIGGTGTLDYSWSNGETGQVATLLCNGNNTLTVTDANDCVYTTDIALALDTLYANITINNILCGGEPDGSAEANPVGGDGGPYTINWSNGDSGPIMSDEFAGIYSATILDGSGCQVDTTFEILEEPPMVLTLDDTTEPSCGGSTDGAIFVSVAGGLPPYDTEWTGPGGFTSTSEDVIAVGAGAYTLTATDANGCEQVLGVVLDEPDAVDATAVVTPLSCAGAADGAIDLTPSGGIAPYDFVWTALPFFTAFTEDISGLEAGTYNVLITDQTGCFTLLSYDLTEPDPLQLDLALTPVTCPGTDDGEIDLTIAGGTPEYTVSWDLDGSGTAASEDLTGLAPGTYTVTVIDANDCVETASVTLDDAVAIDLSAMATPVSCFGDTDGAIDLTVSGGAPTIDLEWTGPSGFTSTSEDLAGLEPGTYAVTATDAGGCVETLDVSIDEPLEIIVNATATPLACADDTNGTIDVDISGGTAPYDTDWTGPGGFSSTDEDLSGLEAGTYTLTVTDANDCQVTVDGEITAPDPTDVAADVTDILCSGDDTGAIDLTITGGTPGYDTSWMLQGGGTSTAEDLTDLAAGDYEVTVTDGAGCQVVINYTVAENPPFDLTETITPLSCAGAADGAIALTLVGGSLPFDFDWGGPGGFTAATQDIFGLEAGPYDVDITDALGCTESFSVMVTEPDAIVLSADITDTSCGNTNDGEIDLTITAGVSPLDIDWTGPGGFPSSNEDLTGLEAGTYDVTVTDADGCQQTSSFDVLPGAVLDITTATGDVSCFGAMDGFLDLTISGGTPPIDVVWTLPGGGTVNSEDLTGLGPGTYDVTVSDVDGCAVDLSFDITEPFELLVSGDPTPITCNSADDGAVDLTVAGGEAPYDIAWTGPDGFAATSEDISGLATGTYEVTVTDNLGCQQVLSFDLSEPGSINLIAFDLPVSCAGEADGSIDMTVFGGTPDFTFDWTGPDGFTANTEDLAGLAAGTYTVEVTDANGCTQSQDYDITEPMAIDTTVDVTDITCFGPGSGAIDLTVTGGQGPYTVTWTFPDTSTQVSEDLTGLDAGDYEALIEDASGCTVTIEATVNETPAFDVTANVTDATCAGLDDGAIELIITGGVGPYDVDWGFTTGPTITGLAAGPYNATITDALGCTQDLNGIMVDEAAPIVVDVPHTNETCPGAADGTIDILSITGGTDPITVSWTGPGGFTSADNTLSGLEAGTYDLLVEDANGCQYTESIEVVAANPLLLTPTVTDPPCGGISEISLDLDGGNGWPTDAGGTPITDWLVEWTADNGFALTENVLNNSTITDLEAGTYTVTVTDFNGCSQALNFDIQNAQALDVQSVVIQPGCGDSDNGSIELAISGGTAPMDVSWTADNGLASADEDLFGLEAGTYTLLVTDANGCTWDQTFELVSPPAIEYTLDVTQPLCAGEATGAVDLNITIGSPPYVVLWTGPNGFNSPAEDIGSLEPGTYTLGIQDASGCAVTTTVDLTPASPVEVSGVVTDLLCAGTGTGAIDITVTGGQVPYTFAWTALPFFTADTEDLNDVEAGTYDLVVTDANGCEALFSATVSENTPITLTASGTDATCGLTDGTLTASATGGDEPYTWSWTDDTDTEIADTPDVADVASGVYTVTLTDANGCEEVATVTVSDSDGPQLDAATSTPLCNGDTNGNIDLTVTGLDPFTYVWTGPNGFTAESEDLTDLEAGTYAVEVTDVNGCVATLDVELTQPDALDTAAAVTDVSCGIPGTGAIDLTVGGGTAPYTVSWTGPDSYSADSEDITGLNTGTYTATITDANLCETTLEVVVDESPALDVTANVTDVACFGETTGSIDLVIGSGTAPFDFVWTGPEAFDATTEDLTGLAAGDYTVDVLDANGCTAQLTVTLIEVDALEVTIDETSPSCLLSNGALEVQASGGTVAGDYNYVWTDVDNGGVLIGTSALLEGIPSGTYHLMVTDDNGCTFEDDIQLSDAGAILEASEQDVLCFGDFTGTIDLTVTGGNPDYNYVWSGPNGFSATSADVTDLEAGTYVVEVTDALGCNYSEAFEVAQPEQLLVELTAGDVLCADSEDGAILTTVTGGVGPYAFTWTGPNGFTDSAQNPADLAPGCYQVTVTDANGCAAAAEVCIGAPAVLELTANLNPILCAGDSTGSIEWVPSGGVGGFMGSWTGPLSNLDNLSPLDSLIAGDYTLALLDANGCPLDTTFTVTEPAPIVLTANTTSPLCVGESNGTIDATLGGGTPDYTIGWTGPDGFTADTQDIADVAAGWYTYTITDDAGCVVTDSLELADPLPLSAEADVDSISCFGFEDAGIDLTPTGGMAPYGFAWNGPDGFTADTEDLADLAPGTYEVLITDLAGCTGTLTFDLLEPTELVVTLTGTSPASCPESEDGSATLQISGGTPEYNVVWSGPLGYTSLEQSPTDLAGGQYAVTVEDANGCQTALQPIDIETLGGVEADAGADLTACEETGPWTLSGTNTGGSSEGWYDADGVQINTSSTLEIQPEPGVYEFIYIANDGLCSDADTVVVEILTSPLADAGADMDVYLEEVVELGGIPAVDDDSIWDWSPGTLLQDSTVANPFTLEITGPQSYILDVVGANGCVASDTITIGITPLLDIPTGFSPNEDGMNDAWTLGFLSFYPNVVVQIYNRWGDLLVESAPGYPEPWDGTYQGDPLPIGTYYYVIRVNEPEFPDPLTGPVTILR